MGADNLGGRDDGAGVAGGLTLAKLREIEALLRRSSHRGENHRLDRLNLVRGRYLGLGRWADSREDDGIAWFISCATFDYGHCIDAPEPIPAGGMRSVCIMREHIPMQSVVMREPT